MTYRNLVAAPLPHLTVEEDPRLVQLLQFADDSPAAARAKLRTEAGRPSAVLAL